MRIPKDVVVKMPSRFPGVLMTLVLEHGRELEYQQIVGAIHAAETPYLESVELRDRYAPADPKTKMVKTVKATFGMLYQAYDRSLTREEVTVLHRRLAERLAEVLPVKVL